MSAIIMGLDLQVASVCGRKRSALQQWCGSGRIRVAPFSKKSSILIWRCVWCGARHGRVDEQTIATLKQFVQRHGWQLRPLKIVDGVAHVA
jgi:hypothetical protein